MIYGYAALTALAGFLAHHTRGPAWAAWAIMAGLWLTFAARLVFAPDLQFVAFGLIWCGIGAFIAIRGEGIAATLLIASGLCYLGAEVGGAVSPGWSYWFRLADILGLAALVTVAAGGDDGMARLRRKAVALAHHRGNRGARAYHRVAVLEKAQGKGR